MAKKKIDAGNLFASIRCAAASFALRTDLMALEEMLPPALQKMYEDNRELYLSVPRYMGVEELADDIQRRGIQQPLLVQRIGEDKYGILSGHSRYKANNIAFARGWAKGAVLPCVIVSDIKNEADVIEAIILNNIQRDKKTSYNKMMEIAELRRVGKIRKKEAKENNEKFSIPDYVKKWLGASDGEISKMMTIYETLGEELMADFREERIWHIALPRKIRLKSHLSLQTTNRRYLSTSTSIGIETSSLHMVCLTSFLKSTAAPLWRVRTKRWHRRSNLTRPLERDSRI